MFTTWTTRYRIKGVCSTYARAWSWIPSPWWITITCFCAWIPRHKTWTTLACTTWTCQNTNSYRVAINYWSCNRTWCIINTNLNWIILILSNNFCYKYLNFFVYHTNCWIMYREDLCIRINVRRNSVSMVHYMYKYQQCKISLLLYHNWLLEMRWYYRQHLQDQLLIKLKIENILSFF